MINPKRIAAVGLGILLFSCPTSLVASIASLGDLTLLEVKARIFTPNGDNFNDKARFEFDNPQLVPVSGTVYDVTGARVADLVPGTGATAYEVLLWDGKDDGGTTVPGGIYLYRIDFQGKSATGTLVVAR